MIGLSLKTFISGSLVSILLVPTTIILSWPTSTSAAIDKAACPHVDLSQKLGPPRNQGNTSWCYAYVAADLIGSAQGLTAPLRVSALDVAINYLTAAPDQLTTVFSRKASSQESKQLDQLAARLLRQDHESFEGKSIINRSYGLTWIAILAYQLRNGLCLEKQLPSQAESESEAPAYIENTLKEMVQVSRGPSANQTQSGNENDLSLKAIDSEIQKRCNQRIKMRAMIPMAQATTGEEVLPLILSQLKKSRPVGIGFSDSFLREGRSSKTPKGDHGGLIIGSRWSFNSSSCEFKLRNSSGKSCDRYHPDFRSGCENGDVWVRETDLSNSVFSVQWIR